ncbi:MAG: M56 family metallopeptidase [Eubacteriales bacterium]|nr:M56 family metallopeptidase [Eubacteriales bacterium]MDD4421407.1 M56 family metallopeptidase [Eubacteriales bacterium]
MPDEVFYWIFNMSITAVIAGAIVMLVRMIRKIPRRIAVLFWIIPFSRMIIPFGLSSPYSLMSLMSKITTKTVVVYQPADDSAFSMMNSITAAKSYFPITYKVNILEQVFKTASAIWITVLLAILITLAVLYFTTLHELKDARKSHDNIYFSDKIQSPAVYGIFKPKIILPERMAGDDVEFILMHENMHIHRADNLWRIMAFLIVTVHWFNPLAWIFLKSFLADIELSCDECVLLKIGKNNAKDYARTLLESASSRSIFASSFGGAKIRTRVENILSFKKMTRLSLFGFLTLIATIFYVLLTNTG